MRFVFLAGILTGILLAALFRKRQAAVAVDSGERWQSRLDDLDDLVAQEKRIDNLRKW